jgi:hypothetical protein
VAVGILLIGDAVGLLVTQGDDGRSTAAPPAAEADAVRAVLPELERFVAAERGLPFKQPVDVELLGDDAFVRRLQGTEERDAEAAEGAEAVLRALHLIDGEVQLDTAVDELLASAVVGFFDPETKELVVRGATPTPYVRSVLVHELVHALQDQHFDLDRDELEKRTDEAAQAFSGLIEGDAVRIQRRYVESLSPEDRRSFDAEEEEGEGPPEGVPDVLVAILAFPYQVGPDFVAALVQSGGPARLDAAFTSPPETSEHLIHPDAYLEGDGPRPVTAPTAEGRVFDRGVFGELGLVLLLAEDLGRDRALEAAAGWGGDRYVAWRKDRRTCVRVRFVMDTPADTAELASALRAWAGGHDDATVAGTGPVLLTSCA